MLVDEHVRQGYTLLEAVEQTKHLRARDDEPEERAPSPPSVPPPPNMAAFGDFERWNQAR